MRRVNKIIVLFFLVVSGLVTFFWQAIQTENFSNFFSEKLTRNFLKDSNAEIKFGKMEINFFPPSTVLKNISVRYRKGFKDGFNLKVDKIALSYNISDLLSNKFKIRSFNFEGGEVFFNDKLFRKNEGEFLRKIKISKFFEKYKKEIKDRQWINLKKISLKNINVIFVDYKFEVSNFTIESFEDKIKSNIRIVNIFNKNEIKTLKDSPIDLITLSATFKEKEILLEEFTLKSMMNKVKGRGTFKEKGNDIVPFLWGESSGDLGHLIKLRPNLIRDVDGPYRLNFKVEGTLDSPVLGINFNAGKISNKYFTINKMKGFININNEKIFLDKVNINDGALLLGGGPTQVYSLKNKEFIFHKASLILKNIRFDEVSKLIGKKRIPLKGNLFGKVRLVLNKNKLRINLDRNFFIKEFFFLNGSFKKTILHNAKVDIGGSSILLKGQGRIGVKLKISTLSSKAKVLGSLNKNGYRFICKNAFVDLDDIGPISGTRMFGKGKINLELIKKRKKKYLKIDLKDVKDFSILNFHLGNVAANLNLNLNSLFLNIKNFNSVVGKSSYNGEGVIGFDKKGEIKLNLDLKKIKFKDGEKIFGYYLKKIIGKDFNLPLEFSTKFKVFGPLIKEKIKVKGVYKVDKFTYKGERIGPGSLDFTYNDEVTSLRNIILIKNSGKINAELDLKNNFSFIGGKVSIKKLRLKDFDFYNVLGAGFSSDIVAGIEFKKDKNKWRVVGGGRLVNSRLKNKKIKDSILNIKSKEEKLIVKGEVAGGIFDFKSEISFNRGTKNDSFFLGGINVSDIKDLFSIISLHNAENEDIDGFIYGDIKSKFNIFDLSKITAILNLERLNISKENIQINLSKKSSSIEVRDGEIKKWDIKLSGGDNFVHTIGKGDLRKKFKIENIFKLNADWVEVLSPKIKVEGGSVGGRHVIFKNEKNFRSDIDLKGENIYFNIENIPGGFEQFNFNFLGQNRDLLIQRFDLKYGKGDIDVEGNIKANLPFPTLDLRYSISSSNVYFLENSNLIFSGKGKILGSRLPYLIEGDHMVFGGRVLDSLMAFSAKNNKESQYGQYLPKFKYLKRSNIINIKATFDIINPIVIKNNFSNLSFDGRVVVFGNAEDPLIKGRLNLIPRVSRFIFKGNEFILTDGFVSFNDEFRRVSPEVNFMGECVVGEFLIKLNIMGSSKSNKVEFTSTPTLSKEDIFSLLTFGVTTNDSQSLEESDRESMTSIGLGSLLVEQFRLNEGITSSLGLKMSILPEFSEDVDSNLLHSQVGDGDSTAKIRSSTKIIIKKKLTEKIDLSVSSTLGGSLEPTQEMNVDLKIDSNVSLEGVYEVKSSTEFDGESSNSAGADLKFQWSFK